MVGKVGAWIFAVALSFGAEAVMAPGVQAQGCQTYSGISYGTYVDGNGRTQNLLLDLMVPAGSAAPVPLVIWIHGGGWSSGSRLPIPANVSSLCGHGFAVASIDYRFSTVARWPAQIQDCKGAVRWLRAHAASYGIDPGRFGAWGASAGGQLAAMLGTSGDIGTEVIGNARVDLEGTVGGNAGISSRVQAVVDWYGAVDFLQMRYFPTPDAPDHDGSNSAESKLIGGPIQDNPELSATASPLTYASPDDPPFLVMHGTADNLYPFHQSRLLVDALTAQGVPVTFTPLPGVGHGGGDWNAAWISQAVQDFFTAALVTAPVVQVLLPAPQDFPRASGPGLPAVSVRATVPRASETGPGAGRFTISLDAPLASDLTVSYHTAGTATSGSDYAPLPGTVTIPAGQTSATVDVQVIDDSAAETGEYVILALEATTAYQVADPAEASVAIADNDFDPSRPIVSVIATDFQASEPGADPGQFTITRTGSTAAALTVSLVTGGTAINGTDYSALPSTVTFNAGVSRLLVTLTPLDDHTPEAPKTATLTVAPAPAFDLGRFEGNTVFIQED
jgi:acetyl esterase/lipase